MFSNEKYNRSIAGASLLFGVIQWILVVIIAEGIQPNYVSSIHYVSSLGTGETAYLYNLSTMILGVCVVTGALLIRRYKTSRAFFIMFLISGLATVGVGVFPEDSRPMHGIVTPIALIFGAVSAMLSTRIQNKPASFFCFALGIVSLITGLWFIPYLGLPVESRLTFLGFYKGTLERIVIYTNLLWVLILGSQLSENQNRENDA